MGYLSQYLERHKSFAGLSAREVARRLGIGINTALGLIEGRRLPEEKTLVKIADYLHPNAPEVRDRELAKLRELALLDTPFELRDDARRLRPPHRALVTLLVDTLLESYEEQPQRVPSAEADEHEAPSNVVQMTQPARVQKAAYNPPDDE